MTWSGTGGEDLQNQSPTHAVPTKSWSMDLLTNMFFCSSESLLIGLKWSINQRSNHHPRALTDSANTLKEWSRLARVLRASDTLTGFSWTQGEWTKAGQWFQPTSWSGTIALRSTWVICSEVFDSVPQNPGDLWVKLIWNFKASFHDTAYSCTTDHGYIDHRS